MKGIVIVIVVAVAGAALAGMTQEQKDKFRKQMDGCVQKSGASKEKLQMIRKGQNVSYDEKTGAYYNCMFKEIHLQDDAGKLHPEKMVLNLPDQVEQAKGEKTIKECCKSSTGDNPQMVAFNVFRCFVSTMGHEVIAFRPRGYR